MNIDPEQLTSGQIVHHVIADAAKGICEAVYERLSQASDKFHARWPERLRKRFIQRFWAQYIGDARNALATMLQPIAGTENHADGPKYLATQEDRDKIFDALVIDGQYKRQPKLTVDQLRANAGFEPLSEVLKAKHGRVLH